MKTSKVTSRTTHTTTTDVFNLVISAIEQSLQVQQQRNNDLMKQLKEEFNYRLKYVAEEIFQTNLHIQYLTGWWRFIFNLPDSKELELKQLIGLVIDLKKERLDMQRRVLSNTNLHNSTNPLNNLGNLWTDSFQKSWILYLTGLINRISTSMQLNEKPETVQMFNELTQLEENPFDLHRVSSNS